MTRWKPGQPCRIADPVTRYRITLTPAVSARDWADGAAHAYGTVVSTSECFNDLAQGFALVDIPAEHERHFDDTLDADTAVVVYYAEKES